MTFDPELLGPTSRNAWILLQARVEAAEGEWLPWTELVDEVMVATGVEAKTASNLIHSGVATGLFERKGRHPHREIRAGDGTPLAPTERRGSSLADRLEQLQRQGPGAISDAGLARREAIIDWIVEERLPNTDLVTRAGKPTALLSFLTKLLSEQDRAAVAAAQLGVEERRLALDETQLADVAAAVVAVLARRGIDATQDEIMGELAGDLRAIEASSEPLVPGA